MKHWYGKLKHSAGLTVWSALFLGLMVIGYFYVFINLYEPVYERWQIIDIINTTAEDSKTLEEPAQIIRQRIFKRFGINGIYGMEFKDLKVKKTEKHVVISFNKDVKVPFPWGFSVITHIKHLVKAERPELKNS